MSVTQADPSKRAFLKSLPLAAAAAAVAPASVAQPSTKPRIIAIEEHFMLPAMIPYLATTKANIRPELFARVVPLLSDFGERRLATMDAGGVDYVVLSLAGPGVQIEPDPAIAERLARDANDALAREIQRHPTRYGGFAHLALQNPAQAADELERCMHQLGFKGAMINGQTNNTYLDDRRYDVFWERAAALQAPIYIHPANPLQIPPMFDGHPELWGPTWSWAVETCTHALRLVFSGTFDRYPAARLILGHMGETLPIQLWRLDSRYPISNHRGSIRQKPSDYIRQNIWMTTSGVCADPALRCAIDAMGADRIIFAIDHPFENTSTATTWIRHANLSETERQQVTSGNVTRLLRL